MLRSFRFYISVIVIGLLPCLTYAASLQVFPVNINFAPGENVKAVYVNNIGNDPISAQVRVYQWVQSNDNDVLTETQNLVVSPPDRNTRRKTTVTAGYYASCTRWERRTVI